MERSELVGEALELLTDSLGGVPRLISVLVALDMLPEVVSLFNLQADLIGKLRPSPRRRRRKQA